jgi:Kef-type K+ transport system membrane component KefB/glycine cleavage system regulatory protein
MHVLLAAVGAEGGVDVADLLLDLLIVLFAAKAGAELADRVGVPAVVGEIVAGILIGTSALDLVGETDVLRFLAELGAILLLLEVGLEMDLRELAKVGRSSMQVAVAGVVIPFGAGWAVMEAAGKGGNTALFVGAALTATSVGITARVFGDLRALATTEARTVLGAAVADDVLGLLILTVVVRIATEGSVSVGTVIEVAGVAVLFLVLASVLGLLLAPRVFDHVQRHSRSGGTLLAVAVVFTIMLAEFASSAKLAPIIGAFVAGIALGRTRQVDRLNRELAPVIHLLVPIFFVHIGVNSEVSKFAKPSVIVLAAGLIVIGVIGKVVGGWVAASSAGDKFLIGLGMIPRGEVGLIFAGIGLTEGVLTQDLYASLLLVVLFTTLMTPPLLKWRFLQVAKSRPLVSGDATPPAGGWLQVHDGVVDLAGTPPDDLGLPIALTAGRQVVDARPGDLLLDWLAHLPDGSMQWSADATAHFYELLRIANPRSWRFLTATGVLERALPEVADAIQRRRIDPSLLDPAGVLRWDLVESVHDELEAAPARIRDRIENPEWLILAALVLEVSDGETEIAVAVGRQLTRRLAIGLDARAEVELLVGESALLYAASRRIDAFEEVTVAQLAVHLRRRERAAALYVLTPALYDLDPLDRQRLDQLWTLLDKVLEDYAETSPNLADVLQQRASQTRLLLPANRLAHRRIETGPRAWLLSATPRTLARQAVQIFPVPLHEDVRVFVVPTEGIVDVVCADRKGLLAAVTGALELAGCDIHSAVAATWPDRMALSSFRVRSADGIDAPALRETILALLDEPGATAGVDAHEVRFDDQASPWYTLLDVDATDGPGVLHAVTAAISAADVLIHSARVRTLPDGRALDTFELTGPRGGPVPSAARASIETSLREGVNGRTGRRRLLAFKRD